MKANIGDRVKIMSSNCEIEEFNNEVGEIVRYSKSPGLNYDTYIVKFPNERECEFYDDEFCVLKSAN